MKKLYTLIFVLFALVAAGSGQSVAFDSIGVQPMTIGVVTVKADTWVIRVERPGGYDDYWPVNLPESYAIPGQEVVFTGARGRVPMNVRMVGTPVKLDMIRVLYRTQPKPDSGEQVPKEEQPKPKPANPDSTGYIDHQHGKVIQLGEVWLIECMIGDEVKRFVPEYLPDDFKHNSSAITFSAIILKHDANVRMMGTPVRIKELMMEEEIPFNPEELQESVKDLYPFDSAGAIKNVVGVVKLIADVYVIEVTENNEMTRYVPAILPKEFQVEGKHIIISGTIGKIPANVRMMGAPLTLTEIRLE